MSEHKSFVGQVLAWIGGIFHKAEVGLVPVILPFISTLLDGVKAVVENPLTAEAISFFHAPLADELFQKVKTALIKVTEEFNLVSELSKANTQAEVDAVLQKVFAAVKWPTEIDKQKFLSSFGARVLQEIKDHEMTFAQAIIDVEYFWENYTLTTPKPAA